MNPLAKRYAIYVLGKPSFQVVIDTEQYAKPAFEAARPKLAARWEDYGIGFSDCVVVDLEEKQEKRKAPKVGSERGARA